MADTEVNVISHLLKVESDASVLVSEAKAEATKRVAKTQAEAEEAVKKQVEQLRQKLDADYSEKIKALSENHKKIIDEYRETVEAVEKDTEAFDSLLTKLLNS